jgi:YbbR domain-containing protein
MGNVFTRNIGWKIVSIVLAFFIWFAVVRFEDPYETESFTHIPVTVLNAEVITSKNQYINFIEGQYVDVILRGKRSIIENLKNEDIKASVDMKYLSYTDALVININTEYEEAIEVIRKSPENMRIIRENVKTDIRKVTYELEGSPKESYVYLDPIITPNTIEIKGPESKIALVRQVKVNIRIDDATTDRTAVGLIKLLDQSGNEVDNIEKSVDEVNIQVPIKKLKKVNLTVNPIGKVPNGFKLTGSQVIPNMITLIGSEEKIDKISNIALDISLNDLTKDTTKEFNLSAILPDGISRYKESNTVSVNLNIDKVQDRQIKIAPHDDISIEKLPEDLNISIINKESFKIVFRGIQEDLNKINIFTLNPKVNLNNLTEGRHEVMLKLQYPKEVELITEPPKVIIELTKRKEQVNENNDSNDNSNNNSSNNSNNNDNSDNNGSDKIKEPIIEE